MSIFSCYNLFLVALITILIPTHCLSADKHSDLQIYVNSSVADKKYTLADVRAIFAMRKTHWNDGKKIQVFVLPDNNKVHRQFTKTRLNMFPHQFRRIWDRLIFSGVGQGPDEVKSLDEMRNKLATVPGAVGYLKKTDSTEKIRVLNYE